MKLEHVMARTVSELRAEAGWTQPELARRMCAAGCTWTPNRVTQIETLRRKVSLAEAAALSWVFGVPMSRLLAGADDELIETPSGKTVPLRAVRAAFTGQKPTPPALAPEALALSEPALNDELRRPAKTIGVTPTELNEMARARYGRGFLAERDRRLGEAHGSPTSIRTQRGHITRRLLTELAERSR